MNGEGEVEVAIGSWLVGGGSGVVEDNSPSYAGEGTLRLQLKGRVTNYILI